MNATLRQRYAALAALVVAVLAMIAVLPTGAGAATPISVNQALGTQDGSTETVRGYVVGQPTASDRIVTSEFPDDNALAIADDTAESDTSKILYVQIPSQFRADWGLKSNPDLVGKQVDVTGDLTSYFSHAGLKNTSSFAGAGGEEPPPSEPEPSDPPPSEPSEPPADYYADAEGKTGDELRQALNGIISEQTQIDYDQVWDALKKTDEDPNNPSNVILLYTQRSQSKDTNGGDPEQWNREHVWAKSHGDFGTATGPGTDVHHLRPTDVSVNATRGNLDFDNGGSPDEECTECSLDGDSFEPPDEVKGDVARMIFYMSIRYEGTDSYPDLEVNDEVNNGSQPLHGKLAALKEWHQADPPSAFEKNRNEVIYTDIQHNRNPFIDHPEWVNSLW